MHVLGWNKVWGWETNCQHILCTVNFKGRHLQRGMKESNHYNGSWKVTKYFFTPDLLPFPWKHYIPQSSTIISPNILLWKCCKRCVILLSIQKVMASSHRPTHGVSSATKSKYVFVGETFTSQKPLTTSTTHPAANNNNKASALINKQGKNSANKKNN